jgi:hypothetical protein
MPTPSSTTRAAGAGASPGWTTGHHYFTGTSIGHSLVFAARAAEDMLGRMS